MQIRNLRIQRFRAIDDLSLDFTDELGSSKNVVALAGPNGSGKTSILYAITNSLRGVLGYRTSDVPVPNRDDMRLSPATGVSWSATPPNVQVTLVISFDEEEQKDIRQTLSLLADKQPPPDLPDGAVTIHWTYPPDIGPQGDRQPWYYSSVEPALPNVRSWLNAKSWAIQAWRKRVPGIAEQLPKLGGLHFFPQDRDLRRRLGVDITGNDEESPSNSVARLSERPTVSDVLDDFSRRFAQTDKDDPRNWESHVKRLYHKICAPKEYLGFRYREDTPVGSPVFSDEGYTYPLTHAASGEHVVLEYIVELCRFGPLNRSIILVDEPEVHLHPLWLRRLYLTLPDFGTGNQFLLTTHSPELLRRAAADNALMELGPIEGVQ